MNAFSAKFKIYRLYLLSGLLFSACASNAPLGANQNKAVPEQKDKSTINQIAKADIDRMTDVEIRENTQSLRLLMLKLYKRNPQELKKSTSVPAEKMIDWVFDGGAQHHFQFAEMNNLVMTDAIFLTFNPEYKGDRVLAFIVGLHTMLLKAHNDKTDFYFTDSIDPQRVYNVARNIEIAVWKLSNARDENGALYLLSNEINNQEKNLSFEREFGKMIGRTELYAIALAEKSQRLISRVVQNLATALFLPF
ncbi:MAG: hypothetical protein Q7U33_08775 [Methylotenera sp.]|uniref:hypothetical protein n=1 Tax=Methylotenera sp. TaxID=2051956 RepID=UPI00271E1154|nr:hypothetical protein [Methylotenera sp.]MDO9151456.1 hypothetical protein [Methylotenera sp.]